MRIARGAFIGIVSALVGSGVISISAAPREVWSRQHDFDMGDHAPKACFDANRDVIYLWRAETNAYLVKASGTSGAELWQTEVPAEVWTTEIDGEGNAVVTGRKNLGEGYRIYTAKYAGSSGSELWSKELDAESATTWAQNVRIDRSGNVVLLGSFTSGNAGYSVLLEYASTNGDVRWQKRIEDPTGQVSVVALALGSTGDVAVAGTIHTNLYVAKFADETGELLWEKEHAHTNTLGAFISTVAVDSGGNVAITGGAAWVGAQQRSQIYTGRFAAEDGSALWQVWRARGTGGEETGVYVMSTKERDVVMAGVHSSDVLLSRYRAADGAVVWERNLHFETGMGNQMEEPADLALDADGNLVIVVTAPQFNLKTSRSKTVKVNAADGVQIWEAIHLNEYIQGIAVGANDSFVVSGQLQLDTDTLQYDAVVRLIRVGPELTIQNAGNEFEVGWESNYSGWSLQKLITTDSGTDWVDIGGSKETTVRSVPNISPGIGIFRLVKE